MLSSSIKCRTPSQQDSIIETEIGIVRNSKNGFYETSGGGATLSGGAPLLHREFCRSVLVRLREAGIHTAVEVRMVLIPEHNMSDADIEKAGEILRPLTNLVGVRLLPYHDLARSKFIALGLPDTLPHVSTPGGDVLRHVAARLRDVLPRNIPILCTEADL